ncbi:MAG TPA: folylpolyglutamate synthase/dihydrofolate synthase family protein [Thermodesulfobacteriota bacterium]|nr:folylpolyglutamate synthase/dihydrofolate synthase family protein [Thermodesulfobacteriota bacterium]
MARMLNAFGNPHQNLKAIHIAGSNGKGSVAAFLAKIFQQAGYRVGLYTSPHLMDFSERIRIQGEPISYDEVIRLTRLIRTKQYEVERDDGTTGDSTSVTCMTFFEFTTLLAFLYFLKKKVDLAVVEVGMGGRLDATNVLTPLVSVITNISKEHQQYLGRTLVEIAGEKAGIIKKNGILLTAVRQPQIFAKISSQCQELGSTLYRLGKHIGVQEKNGGLFDYQGIFSNYKKLKISVLGKYQINNAALAVGVTEILKNQGYQVTENAIREGLLKMKWPGRLEIVNQNPIILLDGAHNLDAIEKLTKELKKSFSYQKLFLVMGIMKDKAIKPILKRIAALGHHIIFTQPKTDRAASPFFLLKTARFLNNNSEVVEDVKQAVQKALSLANQDDLICVTGSLFTIGEARELFFSRVEI